MSSLLLDKSSPPLKNQQWFQHLIPNVVISIYSPNTFKNDQRIIICDESVVKKAMLTQQRYEKKKCHIITTISFLCFLGILTLRHQKYQQIGSFTFAIRFIKSSSLIL